MPIDKDLVEFGFRWSMRVKIAEAALKEAQDREKQVDALMNQEEREAVKAKIGRALS